MMKALTLALALVALATAAADNTITVPAGSLKAAQQYCKKATADDDTWFAYQICVDRILKSLAVKKPPTEVEKPQ